MKQFLAVYIGSEEAMAKSDWAKLDEAQQRERERAGIDAWWQWVDDHKAVIVDAGSPVGRTKRASAAGIDDTRNALCGYTLVRAQSHEDAARLFADHPHFTLFPGDSIEIMECLPLPERSPVTT
ncbi:hypothetical protein ACFOLC_14100 [Lysobacter cavernae]|uniref:YCII-related domain-containing protein n=1 Tax=Lysobacter cavernae TaxID=1685901 RepID=A0ABV7RVB9_9GAMM